MIRSVGRGYGYALDGAEGISAFGLGLGSTPPPRSSRVAGAPGVLRWRAALPPDRGGPGRRRREGRAARHFIINIQFPNRCRGGAL